jgi:hypothetical protein
MPSSRSVLLVLTCAIVGCGCAAGPPALAADSPAREPLDLATIAGCYHLRSGLWERDSLLDHFYAADAIPRALRLHAVRVEGWDPLQNDSMPLLAVTTDPPPQRRYTHSPFSFWQIRPDHVHIGTPMPLGGAHLKVLPAPGGLKGRLTTFTDAIPPDGVYSASADAVLDRISCEAMN